MGDLTQTQQKQMNQELVFALDTASSIITKDYLDKLDTYTLVNPSEEDVDIDVSSCGKIFKLSKLVLNKEENFLNKLTTIVNVASSIECSIATIIKSDGIKIDYYFGIVSKKHRMSTPNDKERRKADIKSFEGALKGNLIGSELKALDEESIKKLKESIFNDEKCFSSVSGIVDLRTKEDKGIEGYVQGIENLVDSLKGQKYTILMIADPISTTEIQTIRQGYELLHTQLASFLKTSVTLNENDSIAMSDASSKGITEGITTGVSMTQSKTKTKGKYSGISAGISANVGISGVFGIGASFGMNRGKSESVADQTGKTTTTTKLDQKTETVTFTATSTTTVGRSLQLNYENRSVKALMDKIDMHLERLNECESFGAFDCAAYIIADTAEETLAVASNYNALMRGQESCVQASHINTWNKPEATSILSKYLQAMVHPRFKKNDSLFVTPASIVSGDEIAIQIGLPKKSINGITVIPMAPFGRNISTDSENTIILGDLYHMGENEGKDEHSPKVELDVDSLAMHTFITGSTGSGKSTAIYSVLDKLIDTNVREKKEKIKFMVIEPAKGEYKNRFGNYDCVSVYGTNNLKMPILKINPFSFPADIHVLEHIERLIEIFNVCWPMYAAMPSILKDSVERAYIAAGWNLQTSECRYKNPEGKVLYPTFTDVLIQINEVMEESQYSNDSKGDYKGALCTRLKSLTNGLYGQIFCSDEIESEKLFNENVIIDLSRTGSSETKALIMGLLVMKLQEFRMSEIDKTNSPLRHVTVLEEAHNILKKTSTEQISESANLAGKSVEMLSNAIAEMRTYGEGFIIADQAPGLMDLSVIRNTNTKIILRLPDQNDRELVGKAANLNDEQIVEISRLKKFVAAIYQNDWLEPVLCNIETDFKKIKAYEYTKKEHIMESISKYIEYLIMPVAKRDELDSKYVVQLKDGIFKLPISADAKLAFVEYTNAHTDVDIKKFRGRALYGIFNSENSFAVSKKNELNIKAWYENMCKVLEPDINMFNEIDRQKILAILTMEKAGIDNNEESAELFDRLMSIM